MVLATHLLQSHDQRNLRLCSCCFWLVPVAVQIRKLPKQLHSTSYKLVSAEAGQVIYWTLFGMVQRRGKTVGGGIDHRLTLDV